MNQQEWIAFLYRYKVQNPRKYVLKYGDKLPEEVPHPHLLQSINVSPIKVEISQKKAVEVDFAPPQVVESKPEPEVAPAVAPAVAPVEPKKPKRAKKATDAA